jgi:hypothetical protein
MCRTLHQELECSIRPLILARMVPCSQKGISKTGVLLASLGKDSSMQQNPAAPARTVQIKQRPGIDHAT